MRNKGIIRLAWAGSICLVAYLSLRSPEEISFFITGTDKIAHGLAYAWLGVLPFFSFEKMRTAFAAALLMIPYGIALEFAQQAIPGRDFSVADMAADAAGVVLGMAAAKQIRERPWFTKVRLRTGKPVP